MKNIKKKLLCGLLTTAITASNIGVNTTKVFADKKEGINVIADWKFDSNNIESGGIKDKDLILKDSSGNENNLRLNIYGESDDYSKYISFSDDKMNNNTTGSLIINGDSANKIGADFITVDGAPINKEEFENGYTIEFIYKLPIDWTVADSWMSLLARQGVSTTMDEPQLGTMNIAVSNCKEIQFLTSNKDDNHKMQSSSWSVSMDKGGVWYHIAIVNDNKTIRTFVNGAEAFRDYVSDDMVGMYADPNDGRFRIGSSWWKEGEQTLDKFARGNYQQVRISEGALDKSQWLVTNPEENIAGYGNNNKFSLKNNDNYNMVFIPDTQNTIKFRGNIMDTAVNWLTENQDNANIVSVTHLGDIVEDGNNEEQWNTAKLFEKLPKANVKLLMQAGNHDWPENFDKYFGQNSDYGKLTSNYVTRTSPSGRSSYMINEAGSYKYMTLAIDYHSFNTDLDWVEKVLSSTNMPTIITSHDLQNCSDTAPSDIKLSEKGKEVWDVVKKYNQVFIMIGGHSHGSGNQILTNDAGNPVFNILADYQFAYNGGNAFFKFAEFDETNNKIYLSTFSPYAATLSDEERGFFDVNYLTGDGNYNEFNINFKERFAGMEKSKVYLQEIKDKLQTLIRKINGLNSKDYTIESWRNLKAALDEANNILEVEEINEEDILVAFDKLNMALDNLKENEEMDSTIDESINKPNHSTSNNGQGNSNTNNSNNINSNNSNNTGKLPQTGGQNSLIYILFGLITTCAGITLLNNKFKFKPFNY